MRYIGIIILLVLCLTLLLLTGCIVNAVIPETTSGNLENQENTEEPVIENTEEPVSKWAGLEISIISAPAICSNEEYDGWIDTLLANGFTEFRETPTYQNTTWLAGSKASIIRNVSKGAKYIWGVSSSDGNTITSANWATFRQAILDAALWAQEHGVFEFQVGNEEEMHNDDDTLTDTQLRTNLKVVATEVQAIFTNGNVSYSCSANTTDINAWISIGKGDIDILACNIYRGGEGSFGDGWKTNITNLVNAFGVNGTYLTEFNLSYTSLDDYSADEAVQAVAITEMIDYIKASGMTRAFYHLWYHPWVPMGVLKDDGTYRLLWDQALLNTGPVKFATVPTKTTIISLPDTIALIPRITR